MDLNAGKGPAEVGLWLGKYEVDVGGAGGGGGGGGSVL